LHNWFFITLNLYNFILCILNTFFKTYLKIITEGFTDGIYPSAFDSSCHRHWWIYRQIYSVGITDSPTTLPTDLIRLYFTVPATITDKFTDRYIRSVFQTLTDKFTDGMNPSVCHTITDGINPSVYFKRETFFWRAISVCKTIGKCFFIFPTNIVTDYGITDERKADGRILSVKTSVNKLPMKS
jgi:hypothetical protein